MLPGRSSSYPLVVLGIRAQDLPDIRGEALALLYRHLPVLHQILLEQSNVDHHGFAHIGFRGRGM